MNLLTLRFVAQWTCAPLATVRRWAAEGKLVPVACEVKTRATLYDPRTVDASLFRDTREAA